MTCSSCDGCDTPCAACHSAILTSGPEPIEGQLGHMPPTKIARRPCPACGELVDADAFFCRGCGRYVGREDE